MESTVRIECVVKILFIFNIFKGVLRASLQGSNPESVLVGTPSHSFDCSFYGDPSPSFVSWVFRPSSGNPVTVTMTTGRYTVTENTRSATLSISNIKFSDAGVYTCNIQNDEGVASDAITLDVIGSKMLGY